MWGCRDVPGTTSECTSFEGAEVVGEVGDDHFHNFVWQATGRFARYTHVGRRTAEQVTDIGLSLTPNDRHAIRNIQPCSANSA